MVVQFGEFVRTRRELLGLSQRDLARRSGVKQPLIAAVESERRRPSPATRSALTAALTIRPSQALRARREAVRDAFARAGLPEPRVFGSVARNEDTPMSDVDLIVPFSDQHDIVDLLTLEHELSRILTVDVDIVDARSDGQAVGPATREAQSL